MTPFYILTNLLTYPLTHLPTDSLTDSTYSLDAGAAVAAGQHPGHLLGGHARPRRGGARPTRLPTQARWTDGLRVAAVCGQLTLTLTLALTLTLTLALTKTKTKP